MIRGPEDDDDRTIISTSFGDSDLPHFVSSSSLFNHTLPDGTRLGEFEIKGLIGEGGFGIVYLAYDESLQRQVALKEYMPSSLAARSNTTATVSVKSDRHRETFQAGLKSFVNEARLLAQFDHPSLVKVYRFWEGHGTAYMVMPYYEGPTLKRALADLGRPPTEAELKAWLRPLMDALEVMHAAHCFHRDIAPDNILLTATGPLLLDFGAARRVIGDMTHALTVVLKPGYAPIEQYGEESSSMPQGAWTDLYALACVVYYAVTGKAPMSSVDRLMADKLKPLSEVAAGRYSEHFLKAIDACLAVRPHERPQSVPQLRSLIDTVPEPAPAAPAAPMAPSIAPLDSPLPMTPGAVAAPPPAVGRPSAQRSSKAPGRLLLVALVLTTMVGLAWWMATRNSAPAPRVDPAPSPAASVPVPTAAAPIATPSAPEPKPVASSSTPAPAAPAPKRVVEPTATKAKAPKAPPEIPQKMQPPPRQDPALRARCGDILQKASLETLNPEETAFLKKECR
ncbi:protein kinase [Aquabacterium sp. CECT 9606]|uniref:serine/threonine protein kinase n=1 Tax=Aquabacterium sp. CECT 9606 TaxID=2845822 RepID=UPI001E385813|nr:protein kinase [Aquabacterium sp. CECT 9606]CAH0348337.1 Serine/threonine-protein kinase PknD [Aquabacterium sp. CECT 9606]